MMKLRDRRRYHLLIAVSVLISGEVLFANRDPMVPDGRGYARSRVRENSPHCQSPSRPSPFFDEEIVRLTAEVVVHDRTRTAAERDR